MHRSAILKHEFLHHSAILKHEILHHSAILKHEILHHSATQTILYARTRPASASPSSGTILISGRSPGPNQRSIIGRTARGRAPECCTRSNRRQWPCHRHAAARPNRDLPPSSRRQGRSPAPANAASGSSDANLIALIEGTWMQSFVVTVEPERTDL